MSNFQGGVLFLFGWIPLCKRNNLSQTIRCWIYMMTFGSVPLRINIGPIPYMVWNLTPTIRQKNESQVPKRACHFTGVECTIFLNWSFTLKVASLYPSIFGVCLMPERALVFAHTTGTMTSWVLESSDPHNVSVWGFVSKRAPLYFLGVPSLKVLWKPENAPWKRETIYRPSIRGVQITLWANSFKPSGFHQLFLQRFGGPIVGQLACFRLKDEDVLLLLRGIMFHVHRFPCNVCCQVCLSLFIN